MFSALTARDFIGWFLMFVGLLAAGTVFFGQVLWFAVPLIAGEGCVSGGICGDMAAVLGLWLQPSLLLAATCVGTLAFHRRGRAVGSGLWALFPLAMLMPNLPSLFMLANVVGLDLAALFLFFPRWSLIELLPLMALGILLCFQVEYMPGFAGSIARTRLYGSIPVGWIYILSCLWIGSGLALSVAPHLGIPVSVAQEIRTVLHFPLSVAGGEIMAGLPPAGERPDLVFSLGTLINLAMFSILAFALAADPSGRLRRPGQLIFIETSDENDQRPMFRRIRKTGD